MNWKPGTPTACMKTWSVPPVLRITTSFAPMPRKGRAESRKIGATAWLFSTSDAADLARAVAEIEIGGEVALSRAWGVIGQRLDQP